MCTVGVRATNFQRRMNKKSHKEEEEGEPGESIAFRPPSPGRNFISKLEFKVLKVGGRTLKFLLDRKSRPLNIYMREGTRLNP